MAAHSKSSDADHGAVPPPSQISALITMIDYLCVEVRSLSPLTAHLLAMARQNLLDESHAGGEAPPGAHPQRERPARH